MSAVQLEEGPHGALVLSLDAPERRNSLRLETLDALSAALQADPDRTVVIGSSTPGIFCAGADLRIGDAERTQVSDRLYGLYEQIVTRPGVVIALVDGPAVGGGAQLATAADLRIVTERARFRWVGPAHGLAVGAWILPELVGRTAALELALTSRWIDAAAAVRLGLATAVSGRPDEDLESFLAALAPGDPSAVARVKRIALGGVVDRLREERRLNRAAWNGHVPA
jgi:enoyl-CoA hydratase/carnithine racemase